MSKASLLKKRRVCQTIANKRAWSRPLEEGEPDPSARGFKGWHTRGYLPHYDHPGVIQMVSYRLHDAMPASRRHEWEALLTLKDDRERRTQLEAYLDRGFGSCHLRDPRLARLVEENLLHFDGERYRLIAWVVMPNHVHLLFEMWETPMSELLKSWKSYTSRMANRLLRRRGDLWQEDYWDRYIRDEAHFNKALHITSNGIR